MARIDLIQIRGGTAAEWADENPVLDEREPGIETDTGFVKFGDGVTAWDDLDYALTGPQGAQGATGAQGPAGPPSSTTYLYQADANTLTGNPGVHQMLWDNATQINATHLHISHMTDDNVDVDVFLALLDTGMRVIVQDRNDSANWQTWTVSGTPTQVIAADNYWIVPVTLTGSAGTGTTDFPNNHELFVAVFPA